MGLRPPLGAAPPPAAPLRVSTAVAAAGPPHARGRRLRLPPGSGRDGCEGSGAAPPGPALYAEPAAASGQQRQPRVREEREEEEEEEGPREARGETTSHGAPPRAMLSGHRPGRCEGAPSGRRPLYSPRRGAAPPAPSNRCGSGRAARLPAEEEPPPPSALPPAPHQPPDGRVRPAPAPRTAPVPPGSPVSAFAGVGKGMGMASGTLPRPPPAARWGWGDARLPTDASGPCWSVGKGSPEGPGAAGAGRPAGAQRPLCA